MAKVELKTVKQFVKRYDMVVFGAIKPDDEIDHVGGLTLSKNRKDMFYAHGLVGENDISLLVRNFSHKKSVITDQIDETWLILKFKLGGSGFPHLFIDTHQSSNHLYLHLIEVMGKFKLVDKWLEQLYPDAVFQLHLFVRPDHIHRIPHFITKHMLETMHQKFSHISIELLDDQLLVYLDINRATLPTINQAVSAGDWLVEYFLAQHENESS